jgi:hypothetical protein
MVSLMLCVGCVGYQKTYPTYPTLKGRKGYLEGYVGKQHKNKILVYIKKDTRYYVLK